MHILNGYFLFGPSHLKQKTHKVQGKLWVGVMVLYKPESMHVSQYNDIYVSLFETSLTSKVCKWFKPSVSGPPGPPLNCSSSDPESHKVWKIFTYFNKFFFFIYFEVQQFV